jgi:hyperosmotically inducible protein
MYRMQSRSLARFVSGAALIGVLGVALIGALSVWTGSILAQTRPDNTKVNTRDRADGAVTADQQKENVADRDLTQKIRRSLMRDKALSTYAHNVKIVSQGGQVTLKGPVRSTKEKREVEAKAVEVAGAGHVVNEISVAPEKRSN